MPRDGTRLLLVSPEHLHLLAEIADVEQLQQMISAGGDQPISIVVPLQVHHGRLVSVSKNSEELFLYSKLNCKNYAQSSQSLAALWVPQFDRLLVVLATGHNQALLRVPVYTLHIGTVATKDLLFGATVKVPHAQSSIVAAGDKFIVRWAETGR